MFFTVTAFYVLLTGFLATRPVPNDKLRAQTRRFFSLAALATALGAVALHCFLSTFGDVNRLDWGPWGQFLLLCLLDMGLYALSLGSCALALPAWLSEGPTE